MLGLGIVAVVGAVAAKGDRAPVELTIFVPDAAGAAGGWGYGGYWEDAAYEYGYDFVPPPPPPPIAVVRHHRAFELTKGRTELVLDQVSDKLEVSTVRMASQTDPATTAVAEVRLAQQPVDVVAAMKRHLGARVIIETATGHERGILRALDAGSVVIDTEKGETPLLVLDRRTVVHRISLERAGRAAVPASGLRVVIETANPGHHELELSYRTKGLSWLADYELRYDSAKRRADVSGRVTIQNDTSARFDHAEVTVASGAPPSGASMRMHPGPYGTLPPTPVAPIERFPLARRLTLEPKSSTQVPLFPDRKDLAVVPIAVFEPVPLFDARFITYPNTDCYSEVVSGPATAYLQVDRAGLGGAALPPGTVHTLGKSRSDDGILAEGAAFIDGETLRAPSGELVAVEGSRRSVDCRADERTRTIRERVEFTLTNTSKEPVEAVVREAMTRWSAWQIEKEDTKGQPVSGGREYRLKVPARGTAVATYTVVYHW